MDGVEHSRSRTPHTATEMMEIENLIRYTVGLFKVLILSSQESERQRGLRGNRPLRIGNVPIVQLTQARDGAVPHTAQPMPDHSSVQAGFIIRDITHPKDPVFNRPVGLQPGERVVWGQGPGKRRAGNPDVAARRSAMRMYGFFGCSVCTTRSDGRTTLGW